MAGMKIPVSFSHKVYAYRYNATVRPLILNVDTVIISVVPVTVGEWISGAVCMYVANYLVENSKENQRVRLKLCNPSMYKINEARIFL